jgi:predicted TIM-barrel fold metal-dependent hydrolase
MIAPSRALEGLEDLELDEETLALYLHENARRVFAISGCLE